MPKIGSDLKKALYIFGKHGASAPNIILRRLRRRVKWRRVLSADNIEDRFTKIYENHLWGDGESKSGPGSSTTSAKRFSEELSEFIKQRDIRSLFDAPCGDFTWMKDVNFPEEFEYVGGDIVEPLISKLSDEYTSKTHKFLHFNIIEESFPDVDIWLCRDCLFHFPFREIIRTLLNFVRSEIPYALITNHHETQTDNLDIEMGLFRELNFYKAPFNFAKPEIRFVDTDDQSQGREVCLWSSDEIRQSLKEMGLEITVPRE